MAKEYKEYVDGEVVALKDIIIQARITPSMHKKVMELCRLYDWKPSYVVRGGLKKFLDDVTLPQQMDILTK